MSELGLVMTDDGRDVLRDQEELQGTSLRELPKAGSLKWWVWSRLGRCEMKNCTPLWREAHFQVKMSNASHARSTCGSSDVQKAHAVVA